MGRLPQGGAPGHTCRAPTPGRTPRSTSAAGSGGRGPQQDGRRHRGLRAQPEYQPRQGLRGAFQFTAGQTEAPEGTTQGLRAAVLALEDEPRPAQSPGPAAAPREHQGHAPWSRHVASETGTEDALPVLCSDPRWFLRGHGASPGLTLCMWTHFRQGQRQPASVTVLARARGGCGHRSPGHSWRGCGLPLATGHLSPRPWSP